MNLPDDIKGVVAKWRNLDRRQQDELYAQELGPRFAPYFARLPIEGATDDLQQPKALIAVLGLSWQPVALMAARCKPESVLLVGTAESVGKRIGDETVVAVIARVAGLPESAFTTECVDDPLEEQIYLVVRRFLDDRRLEGNECWVDPTGGKKSMSASAALAAFVIGAPLLYVDYGEYLDVGRIPVAGTEYPRLLRNPLAVYGDMEIDAALASFDGGLFGEASLIVTRLLERIDDKRETRTLRRIIEGYSFWNYFDFKAAKNRLDGVGLAPASAHPERPNIQVAWRWSKSFCERIEGNRAALDALQRLTSIKNPNLIDSVPLLAFYAASARRLLTDKHQHLSQSVMLAYAMVERYIVLSLQALGACDVRAQFVSNKCPSPNNCVDAGRALFGAEHEQRPFRGNVMFANGALALSTLAPERLPPKELPFLRNLAIIRNATEYEHGLIPRVPAPDVAERLVAEAIDLMHRSKFLPKFGEVADACVFPKLSG